MKKVYYNKLVRDGIPKKIELVGESYSVREIVEDDEYEQELLKKVTEEASALAHVTTRVDFLQEYSDLMVVLDALTAHYEFSEADIKLALEANVGKKGLFKSRYFLEWSQAGTYKSNESAQGTQ